MTSPARLTFPFFLLAALAVLFSVLLIMPRDARAQTVPTLEIADVSASEGAGGLEFTVGFAAGATSTQAVTVDYATADGDALAGNDYTETTGTLTIPPGDSSGVVSVTVNNDRVQEIDEAFTLTLSNPSNAALPGGASSVTVTGTIQDNEWPKVIVTPRQDEVFEGQTIFFDITRIGSAEDDILVSMELRQSNPGDSKAHLDSILYDYGDGVSRYDTVNYPIRAGERVIEWSVRTEDAIEEDFLMTVRLIHGSTYDRGRPAVVRVRQRPVHQSSDPSGSNDALPAVTIAAGSGGEDGVPTVAEGEEATFTLTRDGDTSGALTVRVYTEEPQHPGWTPGTENPSAAFHNVTFTAGSGTATLTVPVEDDGVAEDADWLEAFVSPIDVSLFRRGDPHRAVVNIVDERVDHDSLSGLREIGIAAITSVVDEGERIRVDTVQPVQPYDTLFYAPLNVKVRISQDGSGVPEDRLGIIASVHTKLAANRGKNRLGFPTLDNDGDEPDTTVTFTLLESPAYRIDPDNASITVTVRDLDRAPVLEITDVDAPKGADTIDFQVSFAEGLPSLRTVTVDYHTQDGTAKKGQDYTETSGTLTIPPGETGGVISVPLLPEAAEEAEEWDETFSLVLRDPVNATLSGDATTISATATVSYRPEIRMTALDSEVLEGEAAHFELTRTGSVSADLTVRVNTREPNCPCAGFGTNPTDANHDVTFLAGSNTAILAVGTYEDGKDEGYSNFILAELLSGSEYKMKTTGPVGVNIFDSIPDVTVAVDPETIVEGEIGDGEGQDAIFTLTRTGDASEALTVKVRVDDPEMIRCLDHALWHTFCREGPTFEEDVTFAAGSATATLAVRIYNDWRDVPDDSAVTVTLIDEEGYRPGDLDSASVTLVDDDFASHLTLTTGHVEATEGERVRFTVWRDASEYDIDAYYEHVPWILTDSRSGSADETGVAEMAPGVGRFDIFVDVPEDNDKAERDWSYTFTIVRLDGLIDPIPLELEREQYFTVSRSRSVTVPVRDAGGPRVTIAADAAGAAGITEGEAAAFTLTRRGDTSEALAVRVSVEDPSNFMRGNHTWADPQPPTTVEFAAGSATAALSLPTKDDWRDIPDNDLTVTIQPGDDDYYRPGAPSSASVIVRDNDTKPVFELSVNKETLTEGETVVFTVTRTVDFTHEEVGVLVYVGIQGELRSRVLALTSDKRVATIEFATEDDDLDEADVVYEMEATSPDNDYMTVAQPHTVTVTVVDDDLPRVGIEALSDSYNEGDYAAFRLTREGQANSDLTVRVRLTQTGRVIRYFPEYTFGERTIPILETTSSRDLGFRISSNDGDEEDGAVDLELLPSEDYVIDPDKATDSFTVIDTDSEPTLEAFAPPVAEGDGQVTLVVGFEEAPPWRDERVTVDYSILSGTATGGEDYTAVSGTLTFEPGEEPKCIYVPVTQDSLPEPDETFFLVLSNARNARLPSSARTTTVTIRDDEPHVIVSADYGEITEGETASFAVIRPVATTEELLVRVSLLVGRPGSDLSDLLDRSVTIPASETSVRLTHETEDDDLDAPPFTIIAIVRDPADFNLPSTYLPPVEQVSITVLDNDVATVTIEADIQSTLFGLGPVRFDLTREGDPSDPLTVSLNITQDGESDDGDPLPDSASFATGPSTATFEAGSSTATLRLAISDVITYGPDDRSFSMDRGRVNAALADSDDYITGDPASADVLVVERFADFPLVYIDDADQVVEGEDLVFTLHRTGNAEASLTARLQMRVRKFGNTPPNSYHEVTFEPGSLTTTFTVPTQDNDLNNGNRRHKVSLVFNIVTVDDGTDAHHINWGYNIGDGDDLRYPRVGERWVRDYDIPTVWVTPETGERFEDPEGNSSEFTVHRDSYESSLISVFRGTRQLRRWPPPIPDVVYTSPAAKREGRAVYLNPGMSSQTFPVGPWHVGPLGGESAAFLAPNYCGEDVLADCDIFPQYHIGSPSSGVIQVNNRFAGILVEPVEAEVEEGNDAVFQLTRIGGTPGSNGQPLTVWIEVTQDGKYIEGMPPQTVKFRGWPETSLEESDKTITLSIPTTDDDNDERHGAITLRILPPEIIDVDEPSSYEVGVDGRVASFETGTVRVIDNDYDPSPISISDAWAGESDGHMEFFVTVAPSEREMSVEWNTVTETGVGVAAAGTDYTAASGTLTFAVGETTKTITVVVLEDSQAETDETFKVVLSRQVNATFRNNAGIGTIEDDDEGTVVTIHPQGPYGGTEEGQPAEFILQRVNGTSGIYVDLEISQQGAFLWSSQPTTITSYIPAGVNELTVEITTINDSTVEANGSVTATVQPGSSYSPGKPDTATVNIRDNDLILSIGDAEKGEGQGSMTFAVTLSEAAEKPVTVEVSTEPGKATSSSAITETSLGKDFQARTERLVFEPGETEKSFTVTLVDDAIDESVEKFTVKLLYASSNVWLTDDSATATGVINDNDDTMNVQISRRVKRVDENRTGPVVFAVDLTHLTTVASERDTKLFWEVKPGTATDDQGFAKPYSQQRGTLAIPIGHLTSAIEVNLVDDDLLEQVLETFTVELVEGHRLELSDVESQRKVEISIRDDERLSAAVAPREDSIVEGDNAVFDVRLSGGVTMHKTVLEYTVTGTADSGDDYTAPTGTLTILAGRDAGTITIPTLDDSTLDPGETLEVTLTSGKSGSRNASIPDPTATATILDPGTITISVSPAEAEEGGTLSFALTLSQTSQSDVTVDWRTADDPEAEFAATADVDYVAAPTTVIVPAGNTAASTTVTVPAGYTSAVITVNTNEDTLAAEGTETFRVNLIRARSVSPSALDDLPLGISTAIGTIWDNDIAPTGITLTATPDRVSEDAGATALTVTATLGGQRSLARDTQVQLALEDSAAAADDDYEAATAGLTIPAGQMSATATLTLTPVDDSVSEGNETVTIAGAAGYLAVTPAEVTITDDDAAPTGVTLTLAPGVIGEGAGETELTVTATLTGGDLRPVDTRVTLLVEGVSLTLDDGATTAAATAADFAADFAADAVTLTIPAGRMNGSATLAFTPVDDTLAEGNETAQVSGAAEGLTVTPANMTIEDNDQAPTRIVLSVTPAEVIEGSGDTTLTVTATLEGGGSRISATDVSLTVEGVTATAGDDFTAEEGVTLTIPVGRLSHTAALTLTPVDDNLAEGREEVSIGGSNAEQDLPVVGVKVDLTDNDAQPTKITLSLNKDYVEENRGSQWLTVTASLDGSSRRTVDTSVRLRVASGTATTADYWALAGDLVIEAGEREGTADILLAPTDDHIEEDDETLEVWGSTTRSRSAAQLQVSRQQITIRDDDTAGVTVTPTELSVVEGQDNSYRVVLDSQPIGDVTVTIEGHADTDITVEPASLTFTPGNWSIAQEVSVTAAHHDDATASSDVTLAHTVSGGDYGDVTAADVVVSITEDDVPGVTLTPDTVDIDEGASGSYTVVLDTEPTAEVTVTIKGHADTDITLTGATMSSDALTFTAENWDTAQTVMVTAGEDGDAVDEEEATLAHSASGGGYDEVTAGGVTVTITDNDTAGVTISETALSIDEGGSATYTVKLDTEPTEDVTVAIAGHSGTDITLSGATVSNDALTFTSDNWDTAQTVTVTAGEDGDAVDEEEATLAHSASGGGYEEVTAGGVTVTITDNDMAGVTVSATSLSIDEGATATYTVKLDTEPTASVTVAITGHADTDITLSGATLTSDALTFTSDNWNTDQTVTVSAAQDDDAASDASVTLTHTANGGDYVNVQETVTVTIVEKDTSALSVSDARAAEDGGNVVFTVGISAANGEAVTVDYATSNGTATAGQDYTSTSGTLTFPANSVASRTISVPVTDDTVDEAEEETFTLTLSNVQSASLAGGGSTLVATGTITDNDDPAVTVSFGQASYSADEGGTVGVTLSADPEREVTILLTHDPQGGISDADYSGVPTSLVFRNGETEQSFTFSATGDDIDDDGESVALGFGALPMGVTADTTATVTITDNDTAGVTISATSLSIDEGATATYTVKLDTEPTGDVTVAITGHADTDITLTSDALTFTASNWNTAKTVTVTAARDDDAASDASVTLTHSASGGDYVDVQETVTVTIVEKDASVLSVSDARATEDGGNVVFTVSISATNGETVTVDYATSNGTATAGQDYTSISGTLTFPANSVASRTISVPVTDDTVDEAEEETFTLTLRNVQSASLFGGGSTLAVTGTITDNDDPAVTVSFGQASYSVDEGGTVQVTVTLSADPEREVTIRLIHGLHGGISDADYSGVPVSLVFRSGETETSFTFTAAADDIDDDGESVALTFRTPMPAGVTAGATTTVTITDNDTAGVTIWESTLEIDEADSATYTVVLDSQPTGNVTVAIAGHANTDITLSGATLTSDALTFTAENWDTAQTVTVTAARDDDAASDASVTLTHTANGGDYVNVQETVTVTIVEKDASVLSVSDARAAEDGGNVVFTVSISAANGETVTVDYATSNGTATAGQDYTSTSGTLTFPANSVTSRTISVPITDDTVDEAEEETFTLTLSNVQGASLAGGDSTLDATGTITDNDDPTVTANFGRSTYSVDEGGTVEVTVTLSADPEREVTIPLIRGPQGGISDADYSGVPTSLVFRSGETEKSFNFSAAGDDIDDDGESVALAFGTLPAGVTAGAAATVTITDDDTAGVTIPKTALEIDEGASATYTVVLDTEPTASVTVTIAGHSGTDITLSGTTLTNDALTFTADNWNAAQTVTVSAAEDDDTDADPAVTLTHTVAGGDYQGQSAAGVTVTITENDQVETPQPSVTVSFEKNYHNLSEGAPGSAGVGLVLSAAVEGEVTIPIVVLSKSTAGSGDYSGVPDEVTFGSGETYTTIWIDPVLDAEVEDDELVWLGLGTLPDGVSAGNYSQTYVNIYDAAHLSFGSSSYVATEGGDDAVVTVRVNKSLPYDVSIPLTAEGGSGATSDDWSGVPQELTFAAGETEKTFTVTAVDDMVEDDGEMLTLGFGTLSDRLIAVSPATTVVTLMNMEEPTTTHGLPACSDSDPVMVGAVYSGNIETAGQSEWFNFYLEPYKSYVIEIKGVDTGDGTLEDPALLQWRSALSSFHAILPTPSSASGNRNVERSVWVSIPGVHCFEVASGDNGTGTYKLELQVDENRASGGGPDGYGGHDVPADTSTRITTRWDIEATYGYLGDDGVAGDDEDWFRIVLTEGVEYQIDLEPRTHDLEREVVDGRRQERRVPIDERHWLNRPRIVGVHDANSAVIQDTASTGQGMEVSVDFTPPADGAYYISVGSNSGDRTGLFQLCVKVKDSSRTNRCNEDTPQQQDSSPQQTETENSPATGGPGIAGTTRLGETLTATTEGISDEDGLTGAVFSYQWIRHDFGIGTDTDIAGATGTSYTVTSYDAGHAIKVRVSFTDDASNREALTSYAVAASAPPLTAEFPQSPYQSLSHKGADDRPQMIVEFSRAVAAFAKTTPSVSVTGGAVYSVLAHEEDGLEHAWVFFLDPTGTDEIRFSLLTGQSCEAGGICAADGTTLSVAAETRTIPGLEEEEDETEPQEGQPKKQEPMEPPPAPQNLAAMVNEDGSVTLNWDAPDDDSVTGYQVLRRRPTMDEEALLVHVEDTGSVATTYTDSDMTEGVRQVYRLKAINATGLSESSNYVNVDPPEREANARATGAPVISGTVQVGERLTAATSGIADGDGLDNAAFTYQWLADDADISGATGSTYTLAEADAGKAIKVRVSFTDDADNEETLTSAATVAVTVPLTASLENTPDSHDGQNVFTFELRFSEEPNLSYRTLRDHGFTVAGGTVEKAERITQGSNIRWRITVRPDGDGQVTITLPVTGDCAAEEAICTGDGRMLSNELVLTVDGPGQ